MEHALSIFFEVGPASGSGTISQYEKAKRFCVSQKGMSEVLKWLGVTCKKTPTHEYLSPNCIGV